MTMTDTQEEKITREASNPDFYDADSTTYDEQRWETPGGRHTNRVGQSILLDLCREWKGRRVLEIGPGTARFTKRLAEQGNTITLLDISAGMLEVAKKNLAEAGHADRVEAYVEGSIYELPFEDASFDHALCLNVFNHLEKAGDALKQMARVIRPGSTLMFNFANLHSWYYLAGKRINRRRTAIGQDVFSIWERPSDVRAMIDDAGLELVSRLGYAHVPRAVEKYHLTPFVYAIDAVSRRGLLQGLAPVLFCLCRRT
jgi:SAM-dependent methyltransferase